MNDLAVRVFDIGFTYGIDGPGQRMVVYLKGCNLRCPWCASPESIAPNPEVVFYPDRTSVDMLSRACPYGAVTFEGGKASRDLEKCQRCEGFPCVQSGVQAFELCGYEISIDKIIEQAKEYSHFFGETGGVTIGGGEPTCQFSGIQEILTRLHDEGINTAIETNGTHPWLPDLYPILDTLLIDLKHPISSECAAITGQGNEVALANIAERSKQGGAMIVRIPLVPGYNADEETLHAFGKVLSGIGPLRVEILPFHRRGEVKWRSLGLRMPADSAKEPSKALLSQARNILEQYGLEVR